jgi:hypothetical protein
MLVGYQTKGRDTVLTSTGYGYWWRRHTHRIEDGLEIERFVAADDESEEPAMQHVDAGNFVSAAPAASRKGSSGQSLNRRTSIIEPIDNVYEPSLGSHHYPSNSSHGHQLERYDDSQSSPRLATPIDPAAAYAYAASGRGVHGEEEDSPHARTMSPVVSASGRPLSGQSLYHSSGSGFTSPIADEGRHRYSNGYGNARY